MTDVASIDWNGNQVRYFNNPAGTSLGDTRIYLYEDIIKASGSALLNSEVFKETYPQFFSKKGNILYGLVSEMLREPCEVSKLYEKEWKKVLNDFTSFLKVFHAENETRIDYGKLAIDQILAVIDEPEDSEKLSDFVSSVVKFSRGSKSNSAIIHHLWAIGEVEKIVGKEKMAGFSKRVNAALTKILPVQPIEITAGGELKTLRKE